MDTVIETDIQSLNVTVRQAVTDWKEARQTHREREPERERARHTEKESQT